MTNSEYFEKNKISFSEVMEIFNKQKSTKGGTKSFDKFLAAEHVEHKFKVGDLIVLDHTKTREVDGWDHDVVFEVMQVYDTGNFAYELKALTPSSNCTAGTQLFSYQAWTEDYCRLY